MLGPAEQHIEPSPELIPNLFGDNGFRARLQGFAERLVQRHLVDQLGEVVEEGPARVGVGLGEGPRTLDESLEAATQHRLVQGISGGEVPVDRADADSGAARDLVERHRQALGGQHVPCGGQHQIAVAASVRAHRFGSLGSFVDHRTIVPATLRSGEDSPYSLKRS